MSTTEKIPEENPFRVPDDYFYKVNRKIIAATSDLKTVKVKQGIYVKLRPYIAVAASAAILTLISYTGISIFSDNGKSNPLSGIPVEEYSEIILNDIDLLTLEENLNTSEMPDGMPRMDGQSIIDYLVFENIDIDIIHDQL